MPPNKYNSLKQLFATLSFHVPEHPKGITVRVTDYLEEIEVTLNSEGTWTGRIVLFDGGGDFLENLVLSGGLDSIAKFTFGYEGDTPDALPEFVAQILVPTPEFTPQGIRFSLDLVAAVTLAPMLDRAPRNFAAGLTASEMVSAIAEERGWRTEDRNQVSTIQASVGKLEEYSSGGESDIQFIREHLLKQAHDENGNGFVFFFDLDNAVHFHSINYSRTDRGAGYPLARTYVYQRDLAGEMQSFSVTDNQIAAILMGAGNTKNLGTSSKDGVAAEKETTALGGADDSKLVGKGDTTYRAPVPDTVTSRIPVITRSVEELARLTTSRYSRLLEAAYTVECTVIGTHDIRPQNYISVRYVKKDGTDHYLSGVFKVMSVRHQYNRSGFMTYLTGYRAGTKYTPKAVKIDTKIDATVADGRSYTHDIVSARVRSGGTTARRIRE